MSVGKSAVAVLVLFFLLSSCATPHPVIGTWRESDRSATLKFFENGSFEAEDNQGMFVRGTYVILDGEKMRFDILFPENAKESIFVSISVHNDTLTVLPDWQGGAEQYERVLP